jgi:hypothetical protein
MLNIADTLSLFVSSADIIRLRYRTEYSSVPKSPPRSGMLPGVLDHMYVEYQ